MNTVIRYSEAFKMTVVSEIEVGKWHSMLEAREGYGIGSKATVQRWVRKYGKKTLQTRIVRIQMGLGVDAFKKSRCAAVARALKFNETMSTRALCQAVGMSRQNHYKQAKARTRREIDEELIVQLVKRSLLRGVCGSTFA
jgi:hypothetical protein